MYSFSLKKTVSVAHNDALTINGRTYDESDFEHYYLQLSTPTMDTVEVYFTVDGRTHRLKRGWDKSPIQACDDEIKMSEDLNAYAKKMFPKATVLDTHLTGRISSGLTEIYPVDGGLFAFESGFMPVTQLIIECFGRKTCNVISYPSTSILCVDVNDIHLLNKFPVLCVGADPAPMKEITKARDAGIPWDEIENWFVATEDSGSDWQPGSESESDSDFEDEPVRKRARISSGDSSGNESDAEDA